VDLTGKMAIATVEKAGEVDPAGFAMEESLAEERVETAEGIDIFLVFGGKMIEISNHFIGRFFVGVEPENPVVGGEIKSELALGGKIAGQSPTPDNYFSVFRGERLKNRESVVGGEVVDSDDFGNNRAFIQPGPILLEIFFFVVSEEKKGEVRHEGCLF